MHNQRNPGGGAGILGFLTRLRRDTRGNALAIMAAVLIPLAGFSGSAIDMGRLYAVKSRLQQACDAGVLAGRKLMDPNNTSATLDDNATTQARAFFTNNFQTGWFKTNTVSFTPTKTAQNQVSGAASATVPMTIMTMFGMPSRTVSVSCEARYDVADADLMFVLDTTGSMACVTSDAQSTCDSYAGGNVVSNSDGSYSVTEKTGSTADTKSRIQNLREAVASFYTTLTSQADSSTHFRFGFIPYSATVNVGGLLPRSYMATTTWSYQSRQFVRDDTNGGASSSTKTNISQSDCNALAGHGAYTKNTSSTTAGYTANLVSVTGWVKNSSNSNGTCSLSTQPVKALFRYAAFPLTVTNYAVPGTVVSNPSAIDGDTSSWNGCIEERDTSASSSFSATSPPYDLEVDNAPTSDEATHWRPMWPDAEYARNTTGASEDSYAYRTPLTRFISGNQYEIAQAYNEVPCPRSAQRLQSMSLSDINTYLQANNGFRPYGVTYHDVGMTWGTRLLSDKGIFKNDTVAWPGHNPPNRYIVFLTDGAMEPNPDAYTSHGMETWDKRVTGGTTSNLLAYHNARFATACQIAKNHNITVFLIAYAKSITSLSTEMQGCATTGQTYIATDTAALNDAFGKIAKQVAMLRISK